MADLRALAEELGFTNVRTLLNTGNVVFTSSRQDSGDAAARLEKGISGRLGVSCRVTVLTGAELATIVSENPLLRVATDPSRFLLSVLTDPADRARLEPILKQKWAPEALALGTRVVYMWLPSGVIQSKLAAAVGKIVGDGTTARNWATVLKLHAMAGGSDE